MENGACLESRTHKDLEWFDPRIILLGLYPSCGMHHSFSKHLACGDGTNQDYCEVMTITSDYGMAFITLDSLYSVLSCRPTLPDVLSVLYGQCVDSSGANALPGPYLHQERLRGALGPSSLWVFSV
jgi:hypothetical protein